MTDTAFQDVDTAQALFREGPPRPHRILVHAGEILADEVDRLGTELDDLRIAGRGLNISLETTQRKLANLESTIKRALEAVAFGHDITPGSRLYRELAELVAE